MNLNIYTILLALIIPLFASIVLLKQNRVISKRVLKSSIVMVVQLSISVVILIFIFNANNMLITILFMCVMLLFSFKTVSNNIEKDFKFKHQAKIAITISAFVTVIYTILILSISTNSITPRYIIPLFGMILGNTSTATILASNEIHNILVNNKEKIYSLIYLGVQTKTALNQQLKTFIIVAITPTLASMLNIGFVSLPGMMSGQILAGEVPTTAVTYQMLIMFAILNSITISILIMKHLVIKSAITQNNKLNINLF